MNTKQLCLSILLSGGILFANDTIGAQQDIEKQEELKSQQSEDEAEMRKVFVQIIHMINEAFRENGHSELYVEETEENFQLFCRLVAKGLDADEVFEQFITKAAVQRDEQ